MASQPIGDDEGSCPGVDSGPADGQRMDAEAASQVELLYSEFAGLAFAFLRSQGVDSSSAYEIVHDAFEKIGRAVRDGHGPTKSPRGFVMRVVRNTWIDWVRRPVRRVSLLAEASLQVVDPSGEDGFDRAIELRDQQGRLAALDKALASLPERLQHVTKMHYLYGISISDIAATLEINEGTVRYHLSAARKRLKEILEQDRENWEGEGQ